LTVTLQYVPAESEAILASVSCSCTFSVPSKLTAGAEASPLMENDRGVLSFSAVSDVPPVGLSQAAPLVSPPYKFPVSSARASSPSASTRRETASCGPLLILISAIFILLSHFRQ